MPIAIDLKNQTLLNLRQKLQEAMNANDQEAFAQAFEGILQYYADKNLEDFQALREETDLAVRSVELRQDGAAGRLTVYLDWQGEMLTARVTLPVL